MILNRHVKAAGVTPAFWAICVALTVVAAGTPIRGQAFSSGSDESDGALTLGTGLGTVLFDPLDTARWGRVLDADGDGVYNFTTITIGTGTTLRLRGDRVNRPVYWLASGAVVINGTIDLSGTVGSIATDLNVRRMVSIPGSGGYAGGAGGWHIAAVQATPGGGPGGGSGGVPGPVPCVAAVPLICGKGGTFTGNRFLVPLSGGSGGQGAFWDVVMFGGGAGGGAILIVSSTSISFTNGTITAAGGGSQSSVAGAGSGGAIRLVAPSLSGSNSSTLIVDGGSGSSVGAINGAPGRVRLEGNSIANYTVRPSTAVSRGAPGHPSTFRPASAVRVTAVDGIPLTANPSGSFQVADVVIEKQGLVAIDIEATGIPPGTVVTLQVFPEVPVDQTTVFLPPVQVTLTGTLQLSTGTAMVAFPFGFARCFIQAWWG